jgi:osmotically-inducible protein OsmY
VSTLVVDRKVPSLQGQAADVSLTFAIEASLAKEAGINALQVHIDAHGGHVTLTGHVRTPALRETLADAAKKTHGVLSVTDRLTIAQ